MYFVLIQHLATWDNDHILDRQDFTQVGDYSYLSVQYIDFANGLIACNNIQVWTGINRVFSYSESIDSYCQFAIWVEDKTATDFQLVTAAWQVENTSIADGFPIHRCTIDTESSGDIIGLSYVVFCSGQ